MGNSTNPMRTVTLRNVEILATGLWHGVQGGKQRYTVRDLKEFAAAHAAAMKLGAYVPMYLGHNANPAKPEQPAIGYIAAMRVKGQKLVADITDVPYRIARLMKLGAFRGRSFEGLRVGKPTVTGLEVDDRRNIEIAGQKFAQVITGLALLGRNLPAVDTLSDIEGLYEVAASRGDNAAAGDAETHFQVYVPVGQVVRLAASSQATLTEIGDDAEPNADEIDFENDGSEDGDEGDTTTVTIDLDDISANERRAQIEQLCRDYWKLKPNQPDSYVWVKDLFDKYAAVEWQGKTWYVPLETKGGKLAVGTPMKARVVYVPVAAAAGAVANADAGQTGPPKNVLRMLAALQEIAGELAESVKGMNGAPVVRGYTRGLVERVTRMFGVQHQREDSPMKTTISAALGLAADTEAQVIAAALAEPSDEVIASLVALAEEEGFADANQFVGWLSGALGLKPNSGLDALAAKIAELLGVEAPAEDDTDETGTAPADSTGGATTMGKSKTATGGTESPDVVALRRDVDATRKQLAEVLEWKVKETGRKATEQAESLVDAAIAQAKFKKAQREDLVALAEVDPERFKRLAAAQTPQVKLGQIGHSGGADSGDDEFEPDEKSIAAMIRIGYSKKDARAALRLQKQVAAGVDPDDDDESEE